MSENHTKLMRQGEMVLTRARSLGKKFSRQILKAKGLDFKAVSSPVSLINHKRNWDRIAKWLGEKYQVKRLGQIKPEMIHEFVKEQAISGGIDGKGASRKTLQSYLGAFNKVMYADGRIDRGKGLELRKMDIKVRWDAKYGQYKNLTADEWKLANKGTYEKYRELFDTAEGFGLRRRELGDLNTKSFIQDKNGKMYVQTIGKGGKYRIAESTLDKNERMRELYGRQSIKVDDIEKFTYKKEKLLSYSRDKHEKLNIRGNESHHIPMHIFRSKYAQKSLEEKIGALKSKIDEPNWVGYRNLRFDDINNNTIITIGRFTGPAEAFVEVSQNLGHNRLDVLLKYV